MKNVNDVINFFKMKKVRNVVINNMTWFSLLDVCKVLNIKHYTGRYRCLTLVEKVDWRKNNLKVDGPYNSISHKNMIIVNINGLSKIIEKDIHINKLINEVYFAINGNDVNLTDELKYTRLCKINETNKRALNVGLEASISILLKNNNIRNNILNKIKDQINDVINFATNDKVLLNICQIIYRRLLLSQLYNIIKSEKYKNSQDMSIFILTSISFFNRNIELKLGFLLKIRDIKTYDLIYDNKYIYLKINDFEYKIDLM